MELADLTMLINHNIMENGNMELSKAKECLSIPTKMYIQGNGHMGKNMGMGLMFLMQLAWNMLGNGSKANFYQASGCTPMAHFSKANFKITSQKEPECGVSQTETNYKALMINLLQLETIIL